MEPDELSDRASRPVAEPQAATKHRPVCEASACSDAAVVVVRDLTGDEASICRSHWLGADRRVICGVTAVRLAEWRPPTAGDTPSPNSRRLDPTGRPRRAR